MKNLSSNLVAFAVVVVSSGFLTLSGCSDNAPAGPVPPGAIVEVPEVPASVTATEFCALADEIYCAGAVGCCSGANVVFANVDECMAASRCGGGLDAALASAQMQAGELNYDAAAASTYLRTMATAVSQCADHPESLERPTFLVGTRDVGTDCTPQGKDLTNSFTCKPGLRCVESFDPMTNAMKATCSNAPATPPAGAVGASCASDEDCARGACEKGICGFDMAARYCVAPPAEIVPSNADPTHLYIDLAGSNSGTSGDLTITYADGGKYWQCTITDTLSDGQEKVCVVSATGTVSNSTNEFFQMETNSADGAKIDTVCACTAADTSTNKCTTAKECAGTFNDYGERAGWCSGGSFNIGLWANACSSVWLDSDGNGSCTKLQVNSYDDNYTGCID